MWMKARFEGDYTKLSPVRKTNTNITPCHGLVKCFGYIEG